MRWRNIRAMRMPTVGAVVNAWAGRHDQAISLAERALRFSPFDLTRHLALAAPDCFKEIRTRNSSPLGAQCKPILAICRLTDTY